MNAIVQANSRTMLEPRTFEEAMRFAGMLAKSTMVPKDFQNRPENVLVAVQWGREIGLGPLQALQNIAVINGRPSVWGDAMLALVRGSGLSASIKETIEGEGDAAVATCRVQRRDDPNEIVGTFSVADAKKAGLWGKAGPWQQYPRRMLQLRARGFALRDGFPDVLRGVISAEEAADMPADTFRGVTIQAAAEHTIEAEPVAPEPPPEPTQPKQRTRKDFLDDLERELAAAVDAEAVDAITSRADVQKALDVFANGHLIRLNAMVKVARDRTAPAFDGELAESAP